MGCGTMGCGACRGGSLAIVHTVTPPPDDPVVLMYGGGEEAEARRGSTASSALAFEGPVPSGPRKLRKSLTYIVEEKGTELPMVYLDIVLIGFQAAAAAQGATTAADEDVDGHTLSDEQTSDVECSPSISPTDSFTPTESAGSGVDDQTPVTVFQRVPRPSRNIPRLGAGGSRSNSIFSLSSNASMSSCASCLSNPRQLRCYCQVDSVIARLRFWPLERLDDPLPSFPSSSAASIGYVVLLPVDSPALNSECGKLRQRLDELRFFIARDMARKGMHCAAKPRLARATLYCNAPPKSGASPANDLCFDEELPPNAVEDDTEVLGIKDVTADMGAAYVADRHSLFEVLVQKTAGWLLSGIEL